MDSVPDPRFSSEHKAAIVASGASDIVHTEYAKALGIGAFGVAILTIMHFTGSRGFDSAGDVIAVAIVLAIQVALGLVALFIASMIFGGGAGPLQLASLRMLGILLAIAPLAVFIMHVPCYGLLVVLLVMTGLVMWLFDFETYEAVILVLVLCGINFVSAVFILPEIAAVL